MFVSLLPASIPQRFNPTPAVVSPECRLRTCESQVEPDGAVVVLSWESGGRHVPAQALDTQARS